MPRFRFRHGVHPPDHKELTADRSIRRMPFPDEVVLPLRQHAGKPAKAIVGPGDRVERGDVVGEADGYVSSPIHASATGTVTDVPLWPHPDGSYVRSAGVVGLGGAAFPTHVKLQPPADATIDVLVINGCECEPYLTTDHRTMAEYPDRVYLGIRIMMRCLGVQRAVIGVEMNKADAIAALQRARPDDLDVTVQPLTVKYPQGAEKMLITSLLGREVPSGKLPMHVGVVVQNVASVATIAEVFETGLPLIERIVTVTGSGVHQPANLIVPVGTKTRDLLEACGGLTADAVEVVFGGPMMGSAVANLDAPVLKGTTGVVVLTDEDCRPAATFPCIKCGRCLDACPVFLNPQLLGSLALAERYGDMPEHHLTDCMLCGCCSYVCPSHIPLSQLFHASKAAVRKLQVAS
jgi:electron transport complex protein RnfC